MRIATRFAALVAMSVVLAGCGGSYVRQDVTHVVPYTEEQMLVRMESRDAKYLLQVGDRFKLDFKYEDELDQDNIVVLPDGRVGLAGLQTTVKAAGVSIDDLNTVLTNEFGKDYRNPELSVIVTEVAQAQVYVLGEVKEPGLYKVPPEGLGVIQAVALAGGFTDDAAKSETTLLRASEEGFVLRSLDLSHIEKVGFRDMTYFDLKPYDVIYVPRQAISDFAFVTNTIFGSAINITRFFWDIYALGNLDKIDRIIR